MLEHVSPHAVAICVGRAPGGRGMAQEEVNDHLIRLARQGLRVVRLKGGDPMVFGRGGEEVQALVKAGVAVDLVPGLSSAWAALTLGGIPATHRGVSAVVTVVSGHEPERLPWPHLVGLGGTLVFLMAMAQLGAIAERLMAQGMSADTPAAVIEKASWPDQRMIVAPLRELAHAAEQQRMTPPAVVVVGHVVTVLPPIVGAP